MRRTGIYSLLVALSCSSIVVSSQLQGAPTGDPGGRDAILDWNAVANQCVADDYSNIHGVPDQKGPTHTSRALAIVHLAMFDAANMIMPRAKPYLAVHKPTTLKVVSLDAAVAQAAADTLTAMYPKQAAIFAAALEEYLAPLKNSTARNNGIKIGHQVANDILTLRSLDGANVAGTYVPTGAIGNHNVDPTNPGQGFLDPAWGHVEPFSPSNSFHYVPAAPPAIGSHAYAEAYNEVKAIGGDGITTHTTRTAEQTEIGIFWGYDSAPHIGVPQRMYNQIARTIAIQERNTEIENARLFALINTAMADGGILCWGTKYHYAYWRPILGIREGNMDGNPATAGDSTWTPLGAQASNAIGKNNFTPNFPSYDSGHACGSAVFRVLQHFYGRDNISFEIVSDELNGITTDNKGNVRPLKPRRYKRFSDAVTEMGLSRIYLGIHWSFDVEQGVNSGYAIGDHVFGSMLHRN